MYTALVLFLIFGPFFVFAARGWIRGENPEILTLEGVRIFFRWFLSFIALTTIATMLGLPLGASVTFVVLHHIVWLVVAFYGREESKQFILEQIQKLKDRNTSAKSA